jgi:hypothetical protein
LSGSTEPAGMYPFFDYTPDNNIYEVVFNDYTIFFIFYFFSISVFGNTGMNFSTSTRPCAPGQPTDKKQCGTYLVHLFSPSEKRT